MVAALTLLPAQGRAGTLEVDFALDSTRLQFGSISIVIVLTSRQATGTARIRLSGVDSQGNVTASGGAGVLQSFSLRGGSLTLGPNGPPVPGVLQLAQTGSAGGSFDGMRLQLTPGAFLAGVQATFTPPNQTQPNRASIQFLDTQPFDLFLGGLASPASGAVFGSALLSPDPLQTRAASLRAAFEFSGREVARRFVDEPPLRGSIALFGILLSAAGLGLRARRTRRDQLG